MISKNLLKFGPLLNKLLKIFIMKILVTGKDGQLGRCMQDSSMYDKKNDYWFFNREELDITDIKSIEYVFDKIRPDFVINCAAYTDVKGSEDFIDTCFMINSYGVENLTKTCEKYNAYLVHISTDYVFDGKKRVPYTEHDIPKPLNQYGLSKLNGEYFATDYKKGIVIRTSWLYSEYGKNFYKTNLQRIECSENTNVVCDQIGCPTYARDLSDFIVGTLIQDKDISEKCGLYHFSNNGQASWYDFASAIEMLKENISQKYEPMRCGGRFEVKFNIYDKYITPTTTKEYGDKVKRPKYSVLDSGKLEKTFNVKNKHWLYSLTRCMKNDSQL